MHGNRLKIHQMSEIWRHSVFNTGLLVTFYDRMAEKRIGGLKQREDEAFVSFFRQTSSIEQLEGIAKQYPGTNIEALARNRIDELKKEESLSPPPIRQQSTTGTGLLQCESYSDRPACELDTSCAWVDVAGGANGGAAVSRLPCFRSRCYKRLAKELRRWSATRKDA